MLQGDFETKKQDSRFILISDKNRTIMYFSFDHSDIQVVDKRKVNTVRLITGARRPDVEGRHAGKSDYGPNLGQQSAFHIPL